MSEQLQCVLLCVCVCVYVCVYHFLSNLTEEGAMLEPNISFTLN